MPRLSTEDQAAPGDRMTARTDGDCLTRAILESPLDDAPRLAYADWLDLEAVPPQPERAEFIRVQCELARMPEEVGVLETVGIPPNLSGARWKDELITAAQRNRLHHCSTLRARERKLLFADPESRNWVKWSDVFPGFSPTMIGEDNGIRYFRARQPGDHEYIDLRFGRGFIESVALPLAACAGTGRAPGIAAALFAASPVIRVVLDREPDQSGNTPVSDAGVRMAGWFRRTGRVWRDDEASGIPAAIFDLLPGGETLVRHDDGEWFRWYETPDAANAALSFAAVAHGRVSALGCTHQVPCTRCKGKGWAGRPNGRGYACPDCEDTGIITVAGLPPLRLLPEPDAASALPAV